MMMPGVIGIMSGSGCPFSWTYDDDAETVSEVCGTELKGPNPDASGYRCITSFSRQDEATHVAALVGLGYEVALIDYKRQLV